MEQQSAETDGREYTVVSKMTEHGGMTVVDPNANSTYQIVEYDDSSLRRELAARDVGETVTLELDRAGVRANVWRAARVNSVVLAA